MALIDDFIVVKLLVILALFDLFEKAGSSPALPSNSEKVPCAAHAPGKIRDKMREPFNDLLIPQAGMSIGMEIESPSIMRAFCPFGPRREVILWNPKATVRSRTGSAI